MAFSCPLPAVLLSLSVEMCWGSCTVPTTVYCFLRTFSVSSGRVSTVPSSTGSS